MPKNASRIIPTVWASRQSAKPKPNVNRTNALLKPRFIALSTSKKIKHPFSSNPVTTRGRQLPQEKTTALEWHGPFHEGHMCPLIEQMSRQNCEDFSTGRANS